MKKIVLMMVALMTLTAAQAKMQTKSTPQKKMSHSEMTTQMTSKLKLSDAQKSKVAALNKEYESVLQGPGMCDQKDGKPQGKPSDKKGSRPETTDAQKTQMKQQQVKRQEYNLKLKKILTDDQYKSYQKMQPQPGDKPEKKNSKKSSN